MELVEGLYYEFSVMGHGLSVDEYKSTDVGKFKKGWLHGKRFTMKASSTQCKLVTDLVFDSKNKVDWDSTFYFLQRKVRREIDDLFKKR